MCRSLYQKDYRNKKLQENPNYRKEYYTLRKQKLSDVFSKKVLKSGYISPETGLVFLGYNAFNKNGETWITVESFEKRKSKQAKYRKDNNEKVTSAQRKWYQDNKEKAFYSHNKYEKSRRLTDPSFRFAQSIRAQFRFCLKNGIGKNGSTSKEIFNSLGYSVEELRYHLESQFDPNMNWGNYGQWHVDHIQPVCSFSFYSFFDEEFKKCWSLSNLRPLWASLNVTKAQEDKKKSVRVKK